jgi:hypothetical protein
VEETL